MKRSKLGNTKLYKNIPTPSWELTIVDAEEKLRQARERVRELKIAISVLREKAQSGIPFPS